MRSEAPRIALLVWTVAVAASLPHAVAAQDSDDGRTAATQTPPIDVETILSTPLDPGEYQQATRCISPRRYRTIEVVDEFNVLFVGRRETWLNRLRTRCPGLDSHMMIYLDLRGSRVCTLDHFRAAERSGFGLPTPTCVLGDFELIDETQVDGLRAAIESERDGRSSGQGIPAQEDEG